MELKLVIGVVLIGIILFSGCTQSTPPLQGKTADAGSPATPVPPQNNQMPVDADAQAGNGTQEGGAAQAAGNGTEVPDSLPESPEVHYLSREAEVTVSDGSCIAVEEYTGIEAHALRDADKHYAKQYVIHASGSMSGSNSSYLSFSTDPEITGAFYLTCGDWDVDNVLKTCTRDDNSPESSRWSYQVEAAGEEVAENPDFKVTITAKAAIGNAEGEAEYTVVCPAVDYN